ncbi:hypothetical protein WMY93_018657 [Mugilogobius chulae]|uniref:Uncharacterized protein n=1 Tax=Mugilogobius chulae TaxID=88201 RepID=A0AAW0NKT5_9GOBI
MFNIIMRFFCGKNSHSQNEYSKCKKSSARLKQGWGVLLLKRLFSSPSLKPLVPTLCVLLFVIYGLGDKLHNFVAGIFIPQYHYPYAAALCFGQVVISLLFLNLLHLLGAVSLQSYSRVLGEKLLVPSICSSVYGVLSMWAHTSSSNSVLSSILKLPSPLSTHVSVLISFFSGTTLVITVSRGVSGVNFLEYIYAPLALILFSVSLIWLAKVSEVERKHPPNAQASAVDIYYAHLVNQSVIVGILWLLHPDNPWHVLRQSSWQNLLFHGYLLAILLLKMALNFVVGITALCFSPLAAAVLHSAYQLVLPFLQLL